jgi:hypothetical protein
MLLSFFNTGYLILLLITRYLIDDACRMDLVFIVAVSVGTYLVREHLTQFAVSSCHLREA